MQKLEQNKKDKQKELNQIISLSLREILLKSDMFLSGKKFTRADVSKMMPGKNKIHVQNLTSVLKAEGILCAIIHTRNPTIFYRNIPPEKPLAQGSWRRHTDKELGFEECLVR